MRLTTRTFLFSATPVMLLLALSFYSVQRITTATLTDGLKASLRKSQLSVARFQSRSQADNYRSLKIVGENAPLKAAMQLMLLDAGSSDAKRTLENQLDEVCEPLDLGFLYASTVGNRFLAGMRKDGAKWIPMDSDNVRMPRRGYVLLAGRTYSVTSSPITQGGEEVGTLFAGRELNLAELEMPAILAHAGKVLQSTVTGVAAEQIEASLRHCQGDGECQAVLNGQSYIYTKIKDSSAADRYALLSFQNLDAATGPLAGILRRIFLIAGVGALAGALLVSFLSSRSIVKPLTAMIANLRASESSGLLVQYDPRVSQVKEIRDLTDSFNRTAAAIREGRDDLQRAYLECIGSLASALDARDPYTAGHSQRVSEYACAIAEELGSSSDQLREIRIGALLHDIGKIGIPDSVLQKPGKLTREEFGVIQQHPSIGLHILEGVNGFQQYLSIVELHHENWDGTGYPRGLSGLEVPLGARIVHVADAYDAMTSDRPYRRGMSPYEALQTLNRFSGTQFDAQIVKTFTAAKSSDTLRLLDGILTPGEPAGPSLRAYKPEFETA